MDNFDSKFEQSLKKFEHDFEIEAYRNQNSDWAGHRLSTTPDLVDKLNARLAYEHEYQKHRTNALVKFMIKEMINKE